jgi:hypothetical protein
LFKLWQKDKVHVKEEKENIKEEEHHKVVVVCCLHFMDNQWGKEVVCIEKYPELVFLNPYGDQESMPRHQFRQPM